MNVIVVGSWYKKLFLVVVEFRITISVFYKRDGCVSVGIITKLFHVTAVSLGGGGGTASGSPSGYRVGGYLCARIFIKISGHVWGDVRNCKMLRVSVGWRWGAHLAVILLTCFKRFCERHDNMYHFFINLARKWQGNNDNCEGYGGVQDHHMDTNILGSEMVVSAKGLHAIFEKVTIMVIYLWMSCVGSQCEKKARKW